MLTKNVLPLVTLALLAFTVVHVFGAPQAAEPTMPLAPPAHSPFTGTVAGAGTIEAQTENIAIGSPTPGVVTKVFVRVGQRVEEGDPLFLLDDRVQQAELKFRHAAAAAAEAQLTQLERLPRPEQIPVSEAQVAEAESNLAKARDQWERGRQLIATKVVTEEDLVQRQKAFQAAKAQLARVKSQHAMLLAGAWQYDKLAARAAVDQALAQIDQTKADLDRLTVRALFDGDVLQVNVRPGEFVGAPANQALIVLGDVDRLHARVDIDEHDIPRFKPGAPAVAMLRGLPDKQFQLEFVRVEPFVVPKKSLTGDNTERVDTRVLQAIYAIEAHDQPLYVGQQLDVFIQTPGAKRTEGEGPMNLAAEREVGAAGDQAL
ncbi:MAG TPA: efflux RND transporter periplasmic adaptor subunit [Pirellulales bacterium]|nr:efflux RND transporter periplasmic adaptor subunit [Pirellulales bacterium]